MFSIKKPIITIVAAGILSIGVIAPAMAYDLSAYLNRDARECGAGEYRLAIQQKIRDSRAGLNPDGTYKVAYKYAQTGYLKLNDAGNDYIPRTATQTVYGPLAADEPIVWNTPDYQATACLAD